MTDSDRMDDAHPTAFDALVEKMKADISRDAPAKDQSDHASLLQAVFKAALADAEDVRDSVIGRLNEGKEKIRTEIRSHPVTSISAAFTAGYAIGRAIAGKVRK